MILKNLQLPKIEMYKTKNQLNPPFMIEIFDEKAVPYQKGSTSSPNLPKVRATYYGTDTVRFMGQREWEKVPTEIKTFSSLRALRNHLKSKKCRHCNCRI